MEKCKTREEIANLQKFTKFLNAFQHKDSTFLNNLFEQVLFNSGKIPSNMPYLIDEAFLQTNFIDIVYAISMFDISAGKADMAK